MQERPGQLSRPMVAYFRYPLITERGRLSAIPAYVRAAWLGYASTPAPALSRNRINRCGRDVRTVAGRLGHGGGGAATLRVYSAWVSEADQKAARTFSLRMPAPPVPLDAEGSPSDVKVPDLEPGSPCQRSASDLRGAISGGALRPGDQLPTVDQLKYRYQVSAGTANRAIAELNRKA